MLKPLACLLVLALALPLSAGAEDRLPEDMAALRAAVARGEALPLSAVLPAVMAVVPGELLDVKFQTRETGPVYVVDVLSPDWRLWILIVDARTGVVLNPPVRAEAKTRGQS
jgi:hypothetical protein